MKIQLENGNQERTATEELRGNLDGRETRQYKPQFTSKLADEENCGSSKDLQTGV
jgi:hypothetical protein